MGVSWVPASERAAYPRLNLLGSSHMGTIETEPKLYVQAIDSDKSIASFISENPDLLADITGDGNDELDRQRAVPQFMDAFMQYMSLDTVMHFSSEVLISEVEA